MKIKDLARTAATWPLDAMAETLDTMGHALLDVADALGTVAAKVDPGGLLWVPDDFRDEDYAEAAQWISKADRQPTGQ